MLFYILLFVFLFIITMVILSVVGTFMMRPSASKRVAARTSGNVTRAINKATNPLYGKKGTGIYKNPSRAVKNKVYRARKKKLF